MLKKIWDHLEEIILLPTITFCVLLVFVQVIMRYIFDSSLSWSEELARYLFVWQLWLGASYAARNRSHLRITMVRDRLNPKAQRVIEIGVNIVWITFSVIVCYKGFQLAYTIGSYGQTSTALHLPMQFAYAAIPVGSLLMIIRLIENLIKDYLKVKKAKEETV